MKKQLFILLVSALSFASCKKCGTCQFTTTTNASPAIQGYPQTTKTEQSGCGDDYKDMQNFTSTTSTTNSGGYTITTTMKKTGCQDN